MHRAQLIFSCTVLLAAPVAAQWIRYPTPGIPRTKDGKANLTASAPKAADGKPDLAGIWKLNFDRILYDKNLLANLFKEQVGPSLALFMPAGAEIPMQPSAEALYKQRSQNFGAGRPSERCLPHGIPDAMTTSPFRMVQTRGITFILFEEFNRYRQVFTDGRPFPTDPDPAWFGYSIGKWDGKTFVVETQGFNDQSWLDDYGHPHTDALHTTEHFTRRDLGHMDLEVAFDDPKAYARPWSINMHFILLPDTELVEDVCDNEKDHAHAVGK
jgi:hypothetical protein